MFINSVFISLMLLSSYFCFIPLSSSITHIHFVEKFMQTNKNRTATTRTIELLLFLVVLIIYLNISFIYHFLVLFFLTFSCWVFSSQLLSLRIFAWFRFFFFQSVFHCWMWLCLEKDNFVFINSEYKLLQ